MIESTTPKSSGNGYEPLVSVALPVYNGELYLAEAIDSILAQTYANFELIAIDDGSTDDTPKILRKYERLDPRVRIVCRENRGLATTLNDLIEMAGGRWLARMDQDDIALPHRIERQLEWLESTGADIAGSWAQRFGASRKRIVKKCQTDAAIKREILFGAPFLHPTVMMRTALVKQLRYDREFDNSEDYDLWERAVVAGWKMTNVPEVLLLYRVHAGQISSWAQRRQQQLTQEVRRRHWRFLSSSLNLDTKLIDEALKIFEDPLPEIDMSAVDLLFHGLLQNSSGEVRDVTLDRVVRMYFRLASTCPDIVYRWRKLNREFGHNLGVGNEFKLWVIRLLRIRADGALFKQLRKTL